MSANAYDVLSAEIGIGQDAPEAWENETVLPFWEEPNHADWGERLSRVLYHEATHFWQFLSSGYLANLVSEEWQRLVHFEKTGEVLPPSARVNAFATAGPSAPFSAAELGECWARYWDVHTRSPAQIAREENLTVEGPAEIAFPHIYYTGAAFDTVMQAGRHSRLYARPYRWLLEQVSGHSAFAAIVFPLLVHAAFGSPDPVALFCRGVEQAWQSPELQKRVAGRTGSINLDWLGCWQVVQSAVIAPLLDEGNLPGFTSGLDVIARGPLATHPVFGEYPEKSTIRGWLKMFRPAIVPNDPHSAAEAHVLVEAAAEEPMLVYALPGQPFYRQTLGRLVPPPRIRFRNFTWSATRPVVRILTERAAGQPDVEETFAARGDALDARLRRFRAAEKAVALGLPADAFAS